jgi:O-antigen/teichoic acid export membrane protein
MKSVLIYLTSSIIGKLFPFLLIPILTGNLTPSEYGLWALFVATLSFVDPLVTCSAQTYLAKKYFQITIPERQNIIFNIIAVFLCNFLITLIAGSLFFLLSHSISILFLLVPLLSVLNAFITLRLLILRNENRAIKFGIIEISKIGLCFSIAVVLVVFTELSWVGCVIGFLVGTLLVSFKSIYGMLKWPLNFSLFNFELIKRIYILSLPLLPVGLANVANNAADKFIVAKILGESTLGIYAIGYSFAQLITLFIASYIKYWSPLYYKQVTDSIGSYEFIKKSTLQYIPVILILTLMSYFIIDTFLFDFMVNEKFVEGKVVIPIVMVGLAIQGVYFFAIPFYITTNRTKVLSAITVFSALINIGLNFMLIPVYGLVGAAYSTLFSYVFLSFIGHYLNVQYIKKSS